MNASEKINDCVSRFFITEPLLFLIYCSHLLVVNNNIKRLRSGKRKIEYNKHFIESCTLEEVSEYLKLELIRITLNHPYQRMQENKSIAYIASQLCISELYNFKIPIEKVTNSFPSVNSNLRLQSMEFYYHHIEGKKSQSLFPKLALPDKSENPAQANEEIGGKESRSNENRGFQGKRDTNNEKSSIENEELSFLINDVEVQIAKNNAELWDEDELFKTELNAKILECILNKSCGSLTNNLIEVIKKQIKHQLDYKAILRNFRATVIGSDRTSTRMKPNRRYGFEYLGSKSSFSTHLLIAVDVSGSITKKEIELAFTIINRLFKYGIKTLEFFAFDTEIKGSKYNLKKPSKEFEVKGRGGTDFQCVFDYAKTKQKIDGIIIITDGYASLPDIYLIPPKKILWLLNNKDNYEKMYSNFITVGRCAWVEQNLL
ncbi:MAG TPA: hypothetical protein DCM02_13620 [Flavobacterium sp.]|nr:hypothetical protein [Flavobacterium sp.]